VVNTPQTKVNLLVLGLFTCVAAVYLRPLLAHLGTHIGPDAGDPTLNATILRWNATVMPLTSAWWNQPWFYPASGITAFTENLLGLAPLSTPIYWITQNPVVTYNLTFFATWPLSAFAGYLLVRRLTGRTDAGLVAGFAFGFTPYRISAELGHLQSLAVFWLPVTLLALHAWIETRRYRWLAVFGVAWILQSLANGYYMLFGAVLIALWFAYFGTTPRTWRASLTAMAAWAASSLVLIPVLVGYHRIHEQFALRRSLDEARVFSAQADSWLHASGLLRFWRDELPAGKDLLFPGLMVVAIVAAAVVFGLSRLTSGAAPSRWRAALQWTLAIGAMAGAAAVVVWLGFGAVSIRAGGATLFRMTSPDRALWVLVLCSASLLVIAPVREAFAARRPVIFYSVGAVLMAVLACGPVVTVRDHVLLDPAPYRWLMALPGFDQLRVPSRFWMMGVLCLSVAAGVGYASMVRTGSRVRHLLAALAVTGILADGWLTAMPMKPAPELWTTMTGTDARLPLLELPIGPGFDNAATLRSAAHGRRVLNGVSGYDPPHYAPLIDGLRSRDPGMLAAVAALGAFEVSIERANDRDGQWQAYVSRASGAVQVAQDDARVIWRVPAAPYREPLAGAPWPIASVRAYNGDAWLVADGRLDTDWVVFPQRSDQWLLADLGRMQPVGGVSLAIGEHAADFPRRLAIDVSADGERFETVWQGNPAPETFLAVVRAPRSAWLRINLPSREARFVRIRQLADVRNAGWRVSEMEVNSPAPQERK